MFKLKYSADCINRQNSIHSKCKQNTFRGLKKRILSKNFIFEKSPVTILNKNDYGRFQKLTKAAFEENILKQKAFTQKNPN